MANNKKCILYARLSQDDGNQGESNSITNQRLILEKYANENGFTNQLFLYDDGYSGTNFNRPSIKKVFEMVENDEVDTIIVKDLSRFGREYLQVGQYTEIVFPNYDVRFIAISDGIDSLYGNDDFTPFKNVINELYAKDSSRKIRASKRAKAETGAWLGGKAPYGYMPDPNDPKRHLVPNEETRPIVELIYSLCVAGKGPSKIARELREKQILTPSHYYYKKNGGKAGNLNLDYPYHWRSENIVRILEDEVYIGNLVSLKTTTKSYKNKKIIERPKEEQVRFENTHTAIIKKDVWELVQKLRENKRRLDPLEEVNIFAGLVVCEDCGKKMKLVRGRSVKPKNNNFTCQTNNKKGKEFCTAHYIKESAVKAIVLDDLRRTLNIAKTHEDLFTRYLMKKSGEESQVGISLLEKELKILKNRDEELRSLFKRLYEDNVLGKIPNEVFRTLSDDYLAEQKEIKTAIPQKESELLELKERTINVEKFIERAKEYCDLTELSASLLNIFIEKIVIGEKVVRYARESFQSVTIYYREIGMLDFTNVKELEKLLVA